MFTRRLLSAFSLFVLFVSFVDILHAQALHHYIFFNLERERIADTSFLNTPSIEGAQLKYTWRELEPNKDRYDLNAPRRDLAYLTRHKKKLFIQLQDVSFDTSRILVPEYLLREKEFGGGVALQTEADSAGVVRPIGWVGRRWDPAVQERMRRLFAVLGKQFDGKIEGINFPESSISFDDTTRPLPEGFSFERYRDALIENAAALKNAFPRSQVILYLNFMPGDRHRGGDHIYLRDVARSVVDSGVGLGGPDLLPYKTAQMNNGYQFIRKYSDTIPCGIAVQDGNYAYINPKTNKRVTVQELIRFAGGYLNAHYLFWCTEEPYYSSEVLPLLRSDR